MMTGKRNLGNEGSGKTVLNLSLLTLLSVVGLLILGVAYTPEITAPPGGEATPAAETEGARSEVSGQVDPFRIPDVKHLAAAPAAPAPAAGPAAVPGRRLRPRTPAPRGGSRDEVARAILGRHRRQLGLDRMSGELRLRREFSSRSGDHVRYDQVVDGVTVYGSEVSVHTAPDGTVLLVNADVYPAPAALPSPVVTADEARAVAAVEVRFDPDEDVETGEPETLLLPVGKTSKLVWKVDASGRDESLRVFVDALTGEVASTQNLRVGIDGVGNVFLPNPVFSAQNPTLTDMNDADQPALDNALALVALRRLDGSGYLRGSYADLTITKTGAAYDAANNFLHTRSDHRFEQVNAYFHIDMVQDYIQTVLGLTNVNNRVQEVDAHSMADDNAYYHTGNRQIHLGDGGVDTGEDGDVIIHEYGHSIQHDQVLNFGLHHEGGSMGEGFGDYLAASFHTSGNPAYDGALASWESTPWTSGNPPALRRVDGNKMYPDDMTGEVHDDGEIWASALWAIRSALPSDQATLIILESHFLLTSSARFTDGADAVIAANLAVRGGANEDVIRAAFEERGIPLDLPPLIDDEFEDNDSNLEATPITGGTLDGLMSLDQDWFVFEVPAGGAAVVSASFSHPDPDLDLYLFDSSGTLIDKSWSESDSESVETGAVASTSTFYVVTVPYVGVGTYSLTLGGIGLEDDPLEENDTPAEAALLEIGITHDLVLADDDYFRIPLPADEPVLVRAQAVFDNAAVDLDLVLLTPGGEVLDESAGTGSEESVEAEVMPSGAGEVVLRALPYAGGGAYQLTVWVSPVSAAQVGQTVVVKIPAGEEQRIILLVPMNGAPNQRVALLGRGRSGGQMVVPDLSVEDLDGSVLVPFGTGHKAQKTKVSFTALPPGEYVLKARLPGGAKGKVKIQSRIR